MASPVYQQPAPYQDDAGAGLNGAFKALITLLVIGALGIVLWGATQVLDGDRFNLDLPAIFRSQDNEPTPTPNPPNLPAGAPTEAAPEPTPTPTEPPTLAPIEPENPANPPVDLPTQAAPSQNAPTEAPAPIEPIQPETAPTEEPVIVPAGYDGGNALL